MSRKRKSTLAIGALNLRPKRRSERLKSLKKYAMALIVGFNRGVCGAITHYFATQTRQLLFYKLYLRMNKHQFDYLPCFASKPLHSTEKYTFSSSVWCKRTTGYYFAIFGRSSEYIIILLFCITQTYMRWFAFILNDNYNACHYFWCVMIRV